MPKASQQMTVTVEDEASGRRLTATVSRQGEDVIVAIGGGDRPHVGCVVLTQPCGSASGRREHSASCSVLTVPRHKEEPIARAAAVRLTETLGCVTVVTAGVHEDAIDGDGIRTYLDLGGRLAEALVNALCQPATER